MLSHYLVLLIFFLPLTCFPEQCAMWQRFRQFGDDTEHFQILSATKVPEEEAGALVH